MNHYLREKELEPLMEVLKLELHAYGVLLKNLQTQQTLIFKREPQALWEANQAIEKQVKVNHALRSRRQHELRSLISLVGTDQGQPFESILPYVEATQRELLESFVKEINHLIERTRNTLYQNRSLIGRACELTEYILNLTSNRKLVKTYDTKGNISMKPAGLINRLNASA